MTKEQTQNEQTVQQRIEEIKKLRNGRKPLDGANSRFPQLPTKQGYKTHWFNDEKGRVEQALKLGWEFSKRPGFTDNKVDLSKNSNQRIKVRVGEKADLSDMFAFAMDIPEEIHLSDKKAKEEIIKQREQFIQKGRVDTQDGGLQDETSMQVTSNFKNNFQPN